MYVKYLTPLEQVKEFGEFIAKNNDMSTLTKASRKLKYGIETDSEGELDQQVANVESGLNTKDGWNR